MIEIDKLIAGARQHGQKLELNVYQAIKAEQLLLTTAKNAKPYDQAAEIALLRKMVKTREDSAAMYKQGNRIDLATAEEAEINILKKFLPAPVDANDLRMELLGWCQANGYCMTDGEDGEYVPKKEMGNAIKHLKTHFPIAEGRTVSELVKEYIQ